MTSHRCRWRGGGIALVVACAALLGACSTDGGPVADRMPTTTVAYPRDDELRLNQIQVIGTHNSYKRRMPPEATRVLEQFIADTVRTLDYGHPPLPEQFARQGVRQIELDIFADPAGGLFARRAGASLVGVPEEGPPELREPGYKVQHVQEVDFETTCLTFVACLRQVKDWSDANAGHVPVLVLVEAKDTPIPDPLDLGFAVPVPIGTAELDAIDAEIRSVFDDDDLITPDDVRGDRATLERAVLDEGWPSLARSRGKVLFALDNADKRDEYAAGHPSLRGRVMFTSAEPGEDEAAFIKRNDPTAPDIPELVRKGYLIRTRADADTEQARTGDTTQREAAFASGAQYISTDYVDPDPAMGTDYRARFPGGATVRCNPLNAPPGCTAADIERGAVAGG